MRIWFFFFSSRRRHTSWPRDWSSDVCSSDLLAERDRALAGVGNDRVAFGEFAIEQAQGQRVLDHPLDGALERPRAVDGVIALARQQLLGGGGELQRDALVGEAPRQVA